MKRELENLTRSWLSRATGWPSAQIIPAKVGGSRVKLPYMTIQIEGISGTGTPQERKRINEEGVPVRHYIGQFTASVVVTAYGEGSLEALTEAHMATWDKELSRLYTVVFREEGDVRDLTNVRATAYEEQAQLELKVDFIGKSAEVAYEYAELLQTGVDLEHTQGTHHFEVVVEKK